MILVGLTGGIATGKSTVSSFVKGMDFPVIDLDEISREVVTPGSPAWTKLRKCFSAEFFDPDSGELKRKQLGDLVFRDSECRKKLNSILHPEIRWQMIREIIRLLLKGEKFIVLDMPLLFETKGTTLVQIIVLVTCSPEKQLNRLMARNEFTEEEAQNRIKSQMPLRKKIDRSDIVIDNNDSIEDTEVRVHEALSKMKSSTGVLMHIRGFATVILFAVFVGSQRLFSKIFGS